MEYINPTHKILFDFSILFLLLLLRNYSFSQTELRKCVNADTRECGKQDQNKNSHYAVGFVSAYFSFLDHEPAFFAACGATIHVSKIQVQGSKVPGSGLNGKNKESHRGESNLLLS